ncbi:hypothetical protein BDB00DRAFT_101164 [Zychaea mexicana]|uniref:uncharacterized protein n=1 Tax=Zychaea mexicana TaxID=64656 RepID=UPI0022FECBC0|nr:uncharacterized protein BDB00DRAFT_101164 [Zychaea mexicana]KAI9496636.1 hypothetical protein BDB00DRAFT_101164 [Zychaea mexicana]
MRQWLLHQQSSDQKPLGRYVSLGFLSKSGGLTPSHNFLSLSLSHSAHTLNIMSYQQQPSEMRSDVMPAQQAAPQSYVPEQNVRNVQPPQNVFVVPVVQQQPPTQNEGAALPQAQMQQQQQQQQQQQPGMSSGVYGGSSMGSRGSRPVADQNAFMGTDLQERRASWNELNPRQRAKQLEAEMKDKLKYRKEQHIPEPTKQVTLGGKAIDLQEEQ